ncbi:MAG: hypothetical protein K9J30_03870 [Bacteroidales bacterium]|nr:hypothetical protein [Bacteroidales bacterium]
MKNRRNFIKQISAIGGGAALSTLPVKAIINNSTGENDNLIQGEILTIHAPEMFDHFKPLQEIKISCNTGETVNVYDGNGILYKSMDADDPCKFRIAGALGSQMVLLLDKKQRIIDVAAFKVDTKTSIEDKNEEFRKMLDMLVYSCRKYNPSYFRMKEKTYMTYAGWFQDHVHVFKAMKYFDKDVTSGFDLWAMGQRNDGMLADNSYMDWSGYKSWLTRFGERFVWTKGDKKTSSTFYIRIPVENMSEFTFLEGVYYAWKATGDDAWMKGKLDHCIKAVKYATSDEYRWSEKFQLLKRGYTIDIWDFQPEMDNRKFGGDIMMAKPGITEYSVMFGDNVGMSVGCKYLSEMLEYAGREQEAEKHRQLGETLLSRLNQLSWNGEFYTHHVQENPDLKRDFGNTPLDRQVTISNAYAINRRIGHEKAKAIIETYQRIRNEMPESSPGEWYMCYPPYEKGWHNPKWEYMNGGVSSIVGGELAHGAFEHGFEEYGVDCLRRLNEAAQISDNFMKCIYRGAMPEEPERNFDMISLKEVANADTYGTGAPGVPGFVNEGDNDLKNFPTGKKSFHDIPFDLIDPSDNGRKACLIISQEKNYVQRAELPYNKTAKSIYLIHTHSGGRHMGEIILNYSDGSDHKTYITSGVNISGWWYPQETNQTNLRVAAIVTNARSLAVGAFLYGFNNPYPEKTIKSIAFKGAEAPGKWIILGLTTSDYPVWFMPSQISYGAPDNWGAAAVIYAVLEGLAGMNDTGTAFSKATLSPRWEAAGVDEVTATAKYEASGGYITYKYQKFSNGRYRILFTGNAEHTEVRMLLPKGKNIVNVIKNGEALLSAGTEKIESSTYLVQSFEGAGPHEIEIELG